MGLYCRVSATLVCEFSITFSIAALFLEYIAGFLGWSVLIRNERICVFACRRTGFATLTFCFLKRPSLLTLSVDSGEAPTYQRGRMPANLAGFQTV